MIQYDYPPFFYDEISRKHVVNRPCPVCNELQLSMIYVCHTWLRGDKWMSCVNCDSALEIYCNNESCVWSYVFGLNPKNPRTSKNEDNKPEWLDKILSDQLNLLINF